MELWGECSAATGDQIQRAKPAEAASGTAVLLTEVGNGVFRLIGSSALVEGKGPAVGGSSFAELGGRRPIASRGT